MPKSAKTAKALFILTKAAINIAQKFMTRKAIA